MCNFYLECFFKTFYINETTDHSVLTATTCIWKLSSRNTVNFSNLSQFSFLVQDRKKLHFVFVLFKDLNNRTKKTNGNKASKSVDLKRRSIQASQSNLKKATNVDKPHQNQKKFSCLFKIAPIIASIGFPAYVYALHMFCNEFQCSFKTPVNFSTYQKLSTYFDTQSSLVFTAYVGLLVILSLIPIGGEKVSELSDQHEKFNYNINGVFSLVIATLTIAALEVCGIPAFDYIDKHIVHFIFPAIIFSFLLALFSYVRSFSVPLSQLSSETTSNGALLSFINGREINPRFFGIWDVKVFTIRWCLISAVSIQMDISNFVRKRISKIKINKKEE